MLFVCTLVLVQMTKKLTRFIVKIDNNNFQHVVVFAFHYEFSHFTSTIKY